MKQKLKKRYGSLTGVIPFNGEHIPFESQLERDFVLRTLLYQDIKSIKRAAPIKWVDEKGKSREYNPDFEVITSDHRGQKSQKYIIEVKFTKDLISQKEDLQPRFDATEKDCATNGSFFQIHTEETIRDEFLFNALFLYEYMRFKGNPRRIQTEIGAVEKSIMALLLDMRVTTVGCLMSALSNDKYEQAHYLPFIWRLVALHDIRTDLTKKLTMKSEIWHPKPDEGGNLFCVNIFS